MGAFSYIAAVLGLALSLTPALQLRRLIRLRQSDQVAIAWPLIVFCGTSAWTAYGIRIGSAALIVGNAAAILTTMSTVILARRFRARPEFPWLQMLLVPPVAGLALISVLLLLPTTVLDDLSGAVGVAVALAPLLQARRVLDLRRSDEISLVWLEMVVIGTAAWTIYGVGRSDGPLIAANLAGVLCALATISAVLYVRMRPVEVEPAA